MSRIKVKTPWRREDPRLADIGKAIPNKPKQQPKKKKRKHSRKATPQPFVRPDYYEYMRSAAWKSKRMAAFRHLGMCCVRCGERYGLHVHHRTYANLGRESMQDLEILCSDCHAVEHEKRHPHRCDSLSEEFRKIVG